MLKTVKVSNIKPNPFQARRSDDAEATRSLADEIKKVGLWAGALRGREKNGHVELCFGHRRLNAVKLLKWADVDVDVVELSDEDMALQSLIENLQREGLNDADRGDGIKEFLKLKTGIGDLSSVRGRGGAHEKSANKSAYLLARKEASQLLGISEGRIDQLLLISDFDEDTKEPIRQQQIAGKSALSAKQIVGDDPRLVKKAVAAVAKQGLGFRAMEAIQSEFAALPEETEQQKELKNKVREQFANGKISKPEEVVTKARQIAAQAKAKQWKEFKPDLLDVMRDWTERANKWAKQLDEVVPYMQYIDQEPRIAERWRSAVRELTNRLEKFL